MHLSLNLLLIIVGCAIFSVIVCNDHIDSANKDTAIAHPGEDKASEGDSEEHEPPHKPTKPKHRGEAGRRNKGKVDGQHSEAKRKQHGDESKRNRDRKEKKGRGHDENGTKMAKPAHKQEEQHGEGEESNPHHKEHHHKTCNSNGDCMPGSCCVTKKRGMLRICRPFNLAESRKCLDTCACSNGMECYAEAGAKQGKRKQKKQSKKVKGVCKVPSADDITNGVYLKHTGAVTRN